jgi:hypothetical protein
MVTMDPTARRGYDSGELYNFLAIDAARTGDGFVPNLHWRTWLVVCLVVGCAATFPAGGAFFYVGQLRQRTQVGNGGG